MNADWIQVEGSKSSFNYLKLAKWVRDWLAKIVFVDLYPEPTRIYFDVTTTPASELPEGLIVGNSMTTRFPGEYLQVFILGIQYHIGADGRAFKTNAAPIRLARICPVNVTKNVLEIRTTLDDPMPHQVKGVLIALANEINAIIADAETSRYVFPNGDTQRGRRQIKMASSALIDAGNYQELIKKLAESNADYITLRREWLVKIFTNPNLRVPVEILEEVTRGDSEFVEWNRRELLQILRGESVSSAQTQKITAPAPLEQAEDPPTILQKKIMQAVQELKADYANPPDEMVAARIGLNQRGQPYTRETINRERSKLRKIKIEV